MSAISISDLKNGHTQNTAVPVQVTPGEFTDPNLQPHGDTAAVEAGEKREISVKDLGLPKAKTNEDDNPMKQLQDNYDLIDKAIDRKLDEVRRFNEAIDENGGELSEFEWRAMNGEAATSILVDGIPQEIAESGDTEALEAYLAEKNAKANPKKETVPEVKTAQEIEEDELAALEREAEEEDDKVNTLEDRVAAPTPAKTESTHVHLTDEVKVEEKPVTPPVEQRPIYVSEENAAAVIGKVNIPDIVTDGGASGDDIDDDIKMLLDDSEVVTEEDQERFDRQVGELVRERMKKSILPIDSFKIVQKPVSANNLLDKRNKEQQIGSEFKWPLFYSGTSIVMGSFKSHELDDLYGYIRSAGSNGSKIYRLIYDHVVEGRGIDYYDWAKHIHVADVNNIWFAVYGACFQYTNYMPYDCDDCKEAMLSENRPVMDMVKIKDDAKERFDAIMAQIPSTPAFSSMDTVTIVPISRNIAIGIKEPSIYDMYIMPDMLDNAFRRKYSDVVGIFAFVDNIYEIDAENMELRPVAVKDAADPVKQAKLKILSWAKIIRNLTSDESNAFANAVTTFQANQATDKITFEIPEETCDKCGAVLPAQPMPASDLVFIRHRLGLYGTLQ